MIQISIATRQENIFYHYICNSVYICNNTKLKIYTTQISTTWFSSHTDKTKYNAVKNITTDSDI